MYEQPYNPYATNLAVVKEYFQKPKVLAMGILQILSILVMIVMAIVSSASVSEAISRAPEMDRFISYGGGSVLSAATIVPIIISAIPILVTALGYILLYTGSRSVNGRPTAGATTLFVMAIITLCFTGLGVLGLLIVMLLGGSVISIAQSFGGSYYGGSAGVFQGVYIALMIFIALIVLYEVLYCVHRVRFFNSVRKSATSVELSCKGATGFGEMSVINAVFIGLMLLIYTFAFFAATAAIILGGVNKGIERVSKILMPVLVILVVGIAIYSCTLKYEAPDGTVRSGLEGMAVYFVPDFSGLTFGKLMGVIMDAMGQLFYSISVAMGIMVAYGSYCKDDNNLMKSVNQIEIFDTIVAFLAGVMIIPAVYVFLGQSGLENAGPGLMFVALPQVFAQMGIAGRIFGSVFFLMVLFAALTSSVSILEAVASGIIDKAKVSRKKATLIESGIGLLLGLVVCFGYTFWLFTIKLPNGANAQILDIFDYLSNNILMPIVAIGTCILIGWVAKPKFVIDEVTKNGERFFRKTLYVVMVKVIAPLLLFVLFLSSLGVDKMLNI